jgi:hypothetical protein
MSDRVERLKRAIRIEESLPDGEPEPFRVLLRQALAPVPCEECDGEGEVEITIGGDGYGDRCAALADVPRVCHECNGTGVES